MKAHDHRQYSPLFPEKWPYWECVAQVGIGEIATSLVGAAQGDLETSTRNYVGGLRMALNEIAKVADIDDDL
jgi:hypothetical protein